MKTRKLFAILLAATLLTGCGNETTPQGSAPTVSHQESTAEETKSHIPKEDIIITMAICGEPIPQLAKAIKTFNGLGRGYRIELKDYSSYVDDDDGMLYPEEFYPVTAKMQIDIVNGTDIDIVHEATFMDCGKFDVLCHKGAFADLYSFMENDDEINMETLNSHVLELHEINGALYSLPMSFQVETLKGDAKYVGTKENWTMDELIEKWEQVPENVTFSGSMDKWDVYQDFLKGNIGQFIDYENATVSFNSPEFLRILKFCNSFPETGVDFS